MKNEIEIIYPKSKSELKSAIEIAWKNIKNE
jgi:hypothetical protein